MQKEPAPKDQCPQCTTDKQPTIVTTVTRPPEAFANQFRTRRGVPRPYVEGPPGWRSE